MPRRPQPAQRGPSFPARGQPPPATSPGPAGAPGRAEGAPSRIVSLAPCIAITRVDVGPGAMPIQIELMALLLAAARDPGRGGRSSGRGERRREANFLGTWVRYIFRVPRAVPLDASRRHPLAVAAPPVAPGNLAACEPTPERLTAGAVHVPAVTPRAQVEDRAAPLGLALNLTNRSIRTSRKLDAPVGPVRHHRASKRVHPRTTEGSERHLRALMLSMLPMVRDRWSWANHGRNRRPDSAPSPSSSTLRPRSRPRAAPRAVQISAVSRDRQHAIAPAMACRRSRETAESGQPEEQHRARDRGP